MTTIYTIGYEGAALADLERRIEDAYQASGNRYGWRFLYSPPQVLTTAKLAFIGLNPGGNKCPAEHAQFAPVSGSAYYDECWAGHKPGESPLQRQVRSLFEMIGVPAAEVLAGNFVPFRSPTWGALQRPKDALSFARALWTDIFMLSRPALVIAMGAEVRREMANILGIAQMAAFPTGWGRIKAVRGTNGHTTLIGIPHLSRFRIVGRPGSAEQLAAIFAGFVGR